MGKEPNITAAGLQRPPGAGAAQATTTPTETSPADPALEVCTAFSLGWHTAELSRRWRRPSNWDAPPELARLREDQRYQILWDQVRTHLTDLHGAIVRAGLDDSHRSIFAIEGLSTDPDVERNRVAHLHEAVLGTLTAADPRLGKAYRVGRGIAVACRMPSDLGGITAAMDPSAIAPIVSLLDDLSSALPPHTAYPVAVSLERWSRLHEQQNVHETPELLALLRRQGELWRGLLSGENQPPICSRSTTT